MKRYFLILPTTFLIHSICFAGPTTNLKQAGSQLADIKVPGTISLPTAPQFGIKNVKPSASGCTVNGLNPSSGPWENSPCAHIYGATRIIPTPSTGTGSVLTGPEVLNNDLKKSE